MESSSTGGVGGARAITLAILHTRLEEPRGDSSLAGYVHGSPEVKSSFGEITRAALHLGHMDTEEEDSKARESLIKETRFHQDGKQSRRVDGSAIRHMKFAAQCASGQTAVMKAALLVDIECEYSC